MAPLVRREQLDDPDARAFGLAAIEELLEFVAPYRDDERTVLQGDDLLDLDAACRRWVSTDGVRRASVLSGGVANLVSGRVCSTSHNSQ